MHDKAQHTLKTVFGYDTFRPLQEDVIASVLDKRDTLVIMPTGGGKSLCYQIPALMFPGLTVVVSPLISLMKDQVEQLQALGVDAAFLNSSLSLEAYRDTVRRVRAGQIKLLYLAPEALLRPNTIEWLSACPLDCLTIDEAHCISEWGHDFRPEYRQLAQVLQKFPEAVCVALTATATPRVREDIKKNLKFGDDQTFIASFNRENLFLEVVPKVDALVQTLEFLEKFRAQSGVIYCASRRQVDELAEQLTRQGISTRPYHAGLGDAVRSENQEKFIRDDVHVVVATVAFGMGINKPNVRFVVHYDLPKNIETYYQEIGRAGRDGLPAHCLLLFSYGDIQKVRYFISQMSSEQEQLVATVHLNALLGMVETEVCRRVPLLGYFGETFEAAPCGTCDNCTAEKKPLTDLTVPAQKFLSCVKRTGERFGASHVIDVLRGSESQKVLKFRHHLLSTHGIGNEYSHKQWMYLSRQFVQKGFLSQDLQYGSLKITHKGGAVLRGHEVVMGLLDDTLSHSAPKREVDLDFDRELFERLRQTRKQLADESNVPPYVIFPDRTLMEMAVYFPQSRHSLLALHGVGTAKAQRFGETFLIVIGEYAAAHGIEERPKPGTLPAAQMDRPPAQAAKKRKHHLVGEAYNQGKSIRQLMLDGDVKQDTVVHNLEKYAQEGHPLRAGGFLEASRIDPELQQRVFDLFNQFGAVRLRPVFDAVDEQVDYDELRLLQLYWLNQEVL